MTTPDRPSLYTGRWHLLNGKAVPKGPELDAILALMEPVLGPAPGASAPWPPTPAAPSAPVVADWTSGDLPPVRDVVWMVPPGQRFPIVGAAFTLPEFVAYLAGISDDQMTWSPSAITVHHCAAPSLAQRPDGFLPQHMLNLRSYYTSLGWDRGPHLFIDDKRIWVFSPLTARSIHAVSFNAASLSIEMLGNYDVERPDSGRGEKVTALAAAAVVALSRRYRSVVKPLQFHRDDPKTDKTCPGKLITKDWFNRRVIAAAETF